MSKALVMTLSVVALSACTMNSASQPAPKREDMPRAQQTDRVPGEYVVTLKTGADAGDAVVRNAYSEFGALRVTSIDTRRLLLKFEKDPGLPAIEQKAQGTAIEAVQPNFRYRLQ